MKIAIIGPAYPFRGGLAAFNERLARQLAVDHDVELFTFTLQYPDFLFPGSSQYADGPPPEGLTVHRTISSVNPLSWYSTARRLNAEGFELAVIAFWLPFMGPSLGSIARLLGCHTIGLVHNIIPHESRPGDKAFARYFCNSVDGFVALTDSVADDLRSFATAKPIAVSPHPIYDHYGDIAPRREALARLGLLTDYHYLLFFGLIRDYKGLDLLLEAFANERLSELPLRLLVAGEFYADRAPYDAQIERLGLKGRVQLTAKFIPDEAVADYFNAADLLVQPYKTATQSGVSQIAYHFEKPMIVTDVGGLPEMCPDGRVGYVVPRQPEAIANAIYRFYREADREALRAGVRAEKSRYDWSIMAHTVLNLLD